MGNDTYSRTFNRKYFVLALFKVLKPFDNYTYYKNSIIRGN